MIFELSWNSVALAVTFGAVLARLAWRSTAHNETLPSHNWERKFALSTDEFRLPASVAEVCELVAAAHREQRRVKVVGCAHSWSDIAVPVDRATLLLSLNRLDSVQIDARGKTATFGAGVRLRDAVAALERDGFAFENLPSVHGQSLAGLLATGTHGTGRDVGNLASFCRALSLVDCRGQLHTFVRGRDREFEGVVVHLGAMGVVVEVTFDIVPHFFVHERTSVRDLDTVLDQLPQILEHTKYVKLWPDLASDKVILYLAEPTPERPGRDNQPRWLLDARAYAFAVIQSLASLVGCANAALGLVVKTWPVQDHVAPYHEILVIPHAIPRHAELEMAFPAEHAASVIREFRDLVRAAKLDIGHILEVRFVRRDSIWMSNNYEMDACHITVLCQFRSQPFIDRYFAMFEELVIKRFGAQARPHWGKTYLNDAHVHKCYPKFAEWNALRRRLGGDHMFVNDFLNRLLQPAAAAK